MTVTEYRKTFAVVIAFVLLITVLVCSLAGCDLERKINGAELSFPTKISRASKLSFKMELKYKKGDVSNVISMDCFRAKNEDDEYEYAYVYSGQGALYDSYKNIYADGALYEIVNVTKNTGTYYVKENVSVADEGNILYHITQKIFLIGAAAFVSKAQEETLKGEKVYRYDVMVGGKKVTLWYNSEVLVKIFVSIKDEESGEFEQYTIRLSDFTFDEDLPADAFKRPDTYGITYLPSPMSFEDWMTIITSFAGKLS